MRDLQIAFGWRGADELTLLPVDEARRYMQGDEQNNSPMGKAIHKRVTAVDLALQPVNT